MINPDELKASLDRIANGEEAEEDIQALRQSLHASDDQNVVQIGKYNVNIGQGQELQIGDRIYHGADAETIREIAQSMLQELRVSSRSATVPDLFERPERITNPLRILHLSDLHIGADADPQSMLWPLISDLQDLEEGMGFEKLDYLVISGDLTNRATPQEFEQARQLISELMAQCQLTPERCIIVPGNHDLSWDEEVYTWKSKRQVDKNKLKTGSYLEQERVYLLRLDEQYPQRFKNFSEYFYYPLLQQEYPLKIEEQCIPFLFADTKIQFLAMNSCWEIDEFFPQRASIQAGSLTRGLVAADKQIKQAKAKQQGEQGWLPTDAQILRIAVWHHPITGNEKIEQDAFLERLRQANFKLCLHGHVHEERTDLIGYLHPTRKLYVAGAGSFGAPTNARPESTPRLYNLLEIEPDHSRLQVHTRCLRKDQGAWEGWYVWPKPNSKGREAYYEIGFN